MEKITIVRPSNEGPRPPVQDGPRINEQIRVKQVRLIDEEGENVGVVSIKEALERSFNAGLDLIEISPNADPPVCKISDYGKYKYELQKKRAEMRKKQKIIEVKEIKFRPMIDDHDYEVKLRSMKKFLADGDKVKITLRFRGREMAHQELGMKLLNRVVADLEEEAKVDMRPKLEGRQMIMILSSKVVAPV